MRTTEGRFGGYGLEFYPGYNVWFETAPLTTDRTIITGCSLYWGQRNGASNRRIISLYDGDLLEGMQLRFDTSGEHFVIQRGPVELETITDGTIPIDEWIHLEFKVYCDNSAGTYELRLNGETIASGVDTQVSTTNYHGAVSLESSFHGQVYDDFYICDGAGSKNNDFLGLVKAVPIFPSAEHTTEWETMSGGSNHADAVSEIELDGDSSYIEDDDAGDKDIFDYGDITDSLVDINGLMLHSICRETDATPFDIIQIVRSGGTEYDQTSHAVGSSSYVTRSDLLESDPDTSLDWTKSGINSAQFGVKGD